MSWFSDATGSVAKFLGDSRKNIYNSVGNVANDISKFYDPHGVMSLAAKGSKDVAQFYQNEYSNKADLRGSEIESLLSGVPVVGDVLRGVNGVQQMEDLYNNTGKTAAYPASQNLGASGVGYGAQSLVRKIEDGRNDLYQYYAGEPDQWTANMYN